MSRSPSRCGATWARSRRTNLLNGRTSCAVPECGGARAPPHSGIVTRRSVEFGTLARNPDAYPNVRPAACSPAIPNLQPAGVLRCSRRLIGCGVSSTGNGSGRMGLLLLRVLQSQHSYTMREPCFLSSHVAPAISHIRLRNRVGMELHYETTPSTTLARILLSVAPDVSNRPTLGDTATEQRRDGRWSLGSIAERVGVAISSL